MRWSFALYLINHKPNNQGLATGDESTHYLLFRGHGMAIGGNCSVKVGRGENKRPGEEIGQHLEQTDLEVFR